MLFYNCNPLAVFCVYITQWNHLYLWPDRPERRGCVTITTTAVFAVNVNHTVTCTMIHWMIEASPHQSSHLESYEDDLVGLLLGRT
jgi:hypothetical protein